ncbi:MAG TPA: heme biosynthesis protein HemY, partial [Methylococcales bacterium]
QTYQHVGDWQGIRKLIPSLHNNKILMEAEVKLLETQAYSQLLKESAEKGNTEEIQSLWSEIPNYIKSMPGISATYFAAMIDAGAGEDIEQELADILSVNWDETLVVLFGSIQSNNVSKQLETAEKWSHVHQENAVLLAVMGKLAVKCGDTLKAESYLAKSIAAEPTVQAYQLLGDLLFAQDDKDNAIKCYKNGLELASSEVVSRIDTIS